MVAIPLETSEMRGAASGAKPEEPSHVLARLEDARWKMFSRKVYNYVRPRIRDIHDREDLTQRTMKEFLERVDRGEVKNEDGLIITIASRRICDHYRRQEKERTLFVSYHPVAERDEETSEAATRELPSTRPRPDEIARWNDLLAWFLAGADDTEVKIVTLHVVDGLSFDDIAELLGISHGTAWNRWRDFAVRAAGMIDRNADYAPRLGGDLSGATA